MHNAKTVETVLASKLRAHRQCVYAAPFNPEREFKGGIFPVYDEIRERKRLSVDRRRCSP